MKTAAFTLTVFAFCVVSAHASSPAAWEALHTKVISSCMAKSAMVSPFVSEPVDFDDSVGKVALLLREGSTRNRKQPKDTTIICLYDKRSGKVAIEEIQWKKN
ncbi:hypothetical protein OIV19_16820 [Brucella sp. HL-2]|jgi:hypothetical protein|nr:hypothetical protein [Brucella sp. HL-2]MCV9909265.1 hypothetical protein [Brucella sp. HL-2]